MNRTNEYLITNLLTFLFYLPVFVIPLSCSRHKTTPVVMVCPQDERVWIGPECWANRLQDWRIRNGRIECVETNLPLRTVHILTHRLKDEEGDITMSVNLGVEGELSGIPEESFSGFIIGAGGNEIDYRAASLIHYGSGKNGGLAVGLNSRGKLIFFNNEKGLELIPPSSAKGENVARKPEEKWELTIKIFLKNGCYQLAAAVKDVSAGKVVQQASWEDIEPEYLVGNIALIAHCNIPVETETKPVFWFSNWKIAGSKVEYHQERILGPVISSMFTVSKNILKLTAQMPPVGANDRQYVDLEIDKDSTQNWEKIAKADIITPGWTATFKVTDWKYRKDIPYRLVYNLCGKDYYFKGVIPKDPVDKKEIVIAAFSCQEQTFGNIKEQFDFDSEHMMFPHPWMEKNVMASKPNILAFTGDQVYEARPTIADKSGKYSSYLDYMYKWYLFCWAHRDIMRNIPTIAIPDDHDVYHGNLWGQGGKKADGIPEDGNWSNSDYAKSQISGGYLMLPEFVRMVERTQTGNLPDPFNKEPVEQGIRTYYTDLLWGGISFAILEDRKFKTGPKDVIDKKVNDPEKYDIPQAELLGDKQLEFINHWATDWEGAWMKVAITQTVFANAHTKDLYREPPLPEGVIPEGGYDQFYDFDSNGWPQAGRNKALDALRKGYAFIIAGDQHLATIIHMGIDEWEDAGYSFCTPAISNLYPRRWFPKHRGENHQQWMPDYTGRYLDSFGNKMTIWAVANPCQTDKKPKNLHEWATGFSVVRLNKETRDITMECWPHYSSPSDPEAKQFPGWPMTINMEENYGRKATAWLPAIKIIGMENPPVVQVIDQTGEIVYTLRIKGDTFTPKVFKPGLYTVKIGEPGTEKMKTLPHLEATKNSGQQLVEINFK